MKLHLTDKQQQIVNFDNGPLLVKAGPGTGKTRVVIERIKHLLRKKPMTKILALTFSNNAAEEMRTRIQEDSDLEDLCDNVSIGTIHSFCLDMVQSRGYLIGLPDNLVLFESLDDRKHILEDAIRNSSALYMRYCENTNHDKCLTACLDIISNYKKKFISPLSSTMPADTAMLYSAYNEQLLLQNAIDFDDILFFAYRILTEVPKVARLYTSQYEYICIDEAQDLNYAQYAVIRAMCGENFKNIMLVGDIKQSIYAFNGSNSDLMSVNFLNDFKPTIFSLNENFRSAKAIVDYANSLEKSEGIPNCYYKGEILYREYDSEQDEARAVVEKINYLMAEGHPDIEGLLSYENFAVIGRNKYVFNALETEFEKASIPYTFKKTITGIESASIFFKAFDLELRLLANPKDVLHHNELVGIKSTYGNECNFNYLHNQVSTIDPEELDLDPVFRHISKYLDSLQTDDENKFLAYNDLKLWKSHWLKYASQVPSEQRTLISFRNYVALGKTQSSKGNTGVSLLSAHMSKGLQYEVVFIIGLCEGVFPDYRAVRSGGKDLEQEKNNMYVAVTRAKRLCYLSSTKYRVMPWGDTKRQRPSQFVEKLL